MKQNLQHRLMHNTKVRLAGLYAACTQVVFTLRWHSGHF